MRSEEVFENGHGTSEMCLEVMVPVEHLCDCIECISM